ncbi:uncharacterized protein EI90DRAFT_3154906 [Cantharellus anzutake]|uniref:uncharacterized protein n=1 Tax=Cantharellus anzutake TaxID=1750568 RepID=UPI001905C7F0|nr:uncharacterized protein EI90DRAFT_3154906 [Cantharellus anzutake]KAF8330906.1 hypothetical protein EI90DRAFT_3154906 [Cantharellus anzutake]
MVSATFLTVLTAPSVQAAPTPLGADTPAVTKATTPLNATDDAKRRRNVTSLDVTGSDAPVNVGGPEHPACPANKPQSGAADSLHANLDAAVGAPPPPLYSLPDVLRLLMTSNLLYSAIVFLPLIPLCRLRLKGSCAPKRYRFQALTAGRDGATAQCGAAAPLGTGIISGVTVLLRPPHLLPMLADKANFRRFVCRL